jgi:hypothetical protein
MKKKPPVIRLPNPKPKATTDSAYWICWMRLPMRFAVMWEKLSGEETFHAEAILSQRFSDRKNMPIRNTKPQNIVASLDDDIDEFFGLDAVGLSHQDKKACLLLCDEQPQKDGAELVCRLLDRIVRNRSALTETGRAARGSQTWRWKKNISLRRDYEGIEVRIERAIARLLNDDWVNQVPAASGLTDANNRRCCVDIVHRRHAVEFDFIELKALRPGINSSGAQTPLFASMEVLKYGLLFLFCKKNRDLLFPGGIEHRPILNANRVHLEVLMTPNCYLHSARKGPFRIAWLNRLITDGLNELNEYQKLTNCDSGVQFEFSFKELPQNFVWADEDHEALVTNNGGSPCWITLRDRVVEAVEKRVLAQLL